MKKTTTIACLVFASAAMGSLSLEPNEGPPFYERDWDILAEVLLVEIKSSKGGITVQGDIEISIEAGKEASKLLMNEEYSKAMDAYDFRTEFTVKVIENLKKPEDESEEIEIVIPDSYERMIRNLSAPIKPGTQLTFIKYREPNRESRLQESGWFWYKPDIGYRIKKWRANKTSLTTPEAPPPS